MDTWIVPGAPLPEGKGWRIWYTRAGTGDFSPSPVTVTQGGSARTVSQQWRILPPLPELNRRMGILTVELNQPKPGESFDITIPEARAEKPFRWKTMPMSLDDEGVAFLFGSCFWRDNDKHGSYSAAVRQLSSLWKPAFKMMVGDQIYQDWPAAAFVNKKPFELYADRYDEYWGDRGYQEVMRECPNFFVCDDHEYWNDFPERQVHLSRTWTEKSRKTFGDVALKLYHYYQVCLNPGGKLWYDFKIGPVSFFIADSRTERDPISTKPVPHFFQKAQWDDLTDWADKLTGPGVLVLGQPMYQKDGDWKDHSLSNFREDYGRFAELITKSHRGHNKDGKPHQILMLSGDIHTGRYCVGRIFGMDGALGEVHEFIASAASKVGPYPKGSSISLPPTTFTAEYQKRRTRLDITTIEESTLPGVEKTIPTGDNNIGLVRMFPGTMGRVRFNLSTWRIRPHDSRNWWEMMTGDKQPRGPLIKMFEREIQLQ